MISVVCNVVIKNPFICCLQNFNGYFAANKSLNFYFCLQLFQCTVVLRLSEKDILHIICSIDTPFGDASVACNAYVWWRNIGCKAFI